MVTRLPEIIQIRNGVVCFYVLLLDAEVYLIDTGFIGGIPVLSRELQARGRQLADVRGILLTHGHLDHCFNAAQIAELTGAWVALPAADLNHFLGRHYYTGASHIAGWLESVGRFLSRPLNGNPTRFITPNEHIDIGIKLIAIPFPGHTLGHTVYYSPEHRILFSGDLFASYGVWSHLPPRILNDDHGLMRRSFRNVANLECDAVFPCHADKSSPEQHACVLRRLIRSKTI